MCTRMVPNGKVALALAAGTMVCLPRLSSADQVKLNVALGQPVLKAGQKQTTYLKVGLTGFPMKTDRERTPVNMAIVLDRSGSMSGEKIRKAKEAAQMALDRLSSRDIVSVVAYNHTVNVLMPATKLTDKAAARAAVGQLHAAGNTALFAGVSKGAHELRKFLDRNRVNRVLLLSDGLANVGPSSPVELGDLGASLIKEGMAVTTIGLGGGYNEDLMSQLAEKSDGNHYFAENATDLARLFKAELGDVLSVVAQEVVVKIKCAEGIRPVRVIGREADITNRHVTVMMNQLYSEQEKYVLLEVEVPAGQAGKERPIAQVEVTYANMQTKTTDDLTSTVAARFSESGTEVAKETKAEVMVAAVEQIATAVNERAVELRDRGKTEEAKKVLLRNAKYLKVNAAKFDSKRLLDYSQSNDADASSLKQGEWQVQRKRMRGYQRYNKAQQLAK